MQASPTQGGPIVWILKREGIVSGKICEVVRGHNSYSVFQLKDFLSGLQTLISNI